MPTYTGPWGAEKIIESVKKSGEYYEIQLKGDFMFALDVKYGVEPKVGDIVQQRVRGVTYILGVMINGKEVYSRSDEEDQEIREKAKEESDQRQKESFEKSKDKMDKDFSRLPMPMQRKIERLRKNNPEFRWQFEPYELFVCKEAFQIAIKLKDSERIQRFIRTNSSEVQQKLVPNLKYKEHSGNTFGKACAYALWFVSNPKLFHLSHGAMAELVGCEHYGCLPATDEEIAEAEKQDL